MTTLPMRSVVQCFMPLDLHPLRMRRAASSGGGDRGQVDHPHALANWPGGDAGRGGSCRLQHLHDLTCATTAPLAGRTRMTLDRHEDSTVIALARTTPSIAPLAAPLERSARRAERETKTCCRDCTVGQGRHEQSGIRPPRTR